MTASKRTKWIGVIGLVAIACSMATAKADVVDDPNYFALFLPPLPLASLITIDSNVKATILRDPSRGNPGWGKAIGLLEIGIGGAQLVVAREGSSNNREMMQFAAGFHVILGALTLWAASSAPTEAKQRDVAIQYAPGSRGVQLTLSF